EEIAEDSVLADTKLIAEPWDAVGLYQVGRFPFGRRWSEWNGRYRDDVRRFWRGEPGMASALASRLCGSSDLYAPSGRRARRSVPGQRNELARLAAGGGERGLLALREGDDRLAEAAPGVAAAVLLPRWHLAARRRLARRLRRLAGLLGREPRTGADPGRPAHR